MVADAAVRIPINRRYSGKDKPCRRACGSQRARSVGVGLIVAKRWMTGRVGDRGIRAVP